MIHLEQTQLALVKPILDLVLLGDEPVVPAPLSVN
jgi:hypothetical protein